MPVVQRLLRIDGISAGWILGTKLPLTRVSIRSSFAGDLSCIRETQSRAWDCDPVH